MGGTMPLAQKSARLQGLVAGLEDAGSRWVSKLVMSPARAAMALVVLVLALHLGGNLLLPPLDRTEVIYAQAARQMIEGGPGSWTTPAFQTEPKFEKPIAVLWLQAASALVTGQADQIRGYRIPSILGTILAVLMTYWGARRIFDARTAFMGAALLPTMLVVTVHTTLAMPEALMLAATCAAMFALGRAYVAHDDAGAGRNNALLFWAALGLGVLVNVVTIPLIALLTALALVVWDRGEAHWLKSLVSVPGMIVFALLAALWPFVLWQAGTLDAALVQWRAEGLHLLLGPQEMKWRVLPGLFVVFLLLGMFPAGLFLAPSMVAAWRARTAPAIRFLIAWVVPYLLFLELFTRKTPLYMVQAMLPPLAILFALWVTREAEATVDSSDSGNVIHQRRWFRLGTLGWLLLVLGLVVALWVLPFLLKMTVSPLAVLLGLAVLALAAVTTEAMLSGHRIATATSLIAMAIAFNNLTIPVTFAGLRPIWVATEVRAAVDALRPCQSGNAWIEGYNEPSGVFELGLRDVSLVGFPVYFAGTDSRWKEGMEDPKARAEMLPVACVAGFDFIHSCSHRITVSVLASGNTSFEKCKLPARFRCENVPAKPMIGKMCK